MLCFCNFLCLTHMAPSFHPSATTVCVMDASSTLGLTLIQRLLNKGYTVHASLQHHGEEDNQEEVLKGICGDSKKLKTFPCDPFDYHTILDALQGCSGLFYCFQPPQDHPTYDESMADVEVRAAHNVIEACAQTETIQKVVFTSCATAVIWREDHKSLNLHLEEKHWSDPNFCRKYKLWHALSKTVAEKTAWALAMDRGVQMVSINGGLVMNEDVSINNPYLRGAAEMYEDGVLVSVDLDYFVDAHLCVYEDVSSYGRYLCFNHVINNNHDAFHLAIKLTPASSLPPPPGCEPEKAFIQQRICNDKLNKLMLHYFKD